MAGYQCSCGYQTGDRSNFNRHLGACEVETRCGPREHSGRKLKVDDEDLFDVGTRGGPREHSGRTGANTRAQAVREATRCLSL